MAILAFQRPEKVIVVESTASFGKFEFRPLEPGYAMTIGNALRRVYIRAHRHTPYGKCPRRVVSCNQLYYRD